MSTILRRICELAVRRKITVCTSRLVWLINKKNMKGGGVITRVCKQHLIQNNLELNRNLKGM